MAGLLFSFGENAPQIHESCGNEFSRIKPLQPSYNYAEKFLHITKYKRPHEDEHNCIIGSEINIYVVGNLIYKGYSGEKALQYLHTDLAKQGVEKLLECIDGIFCLVIHNLSTKQLYLITDHVGILNLYLHQTNNSFSISTSALSLSRTFPVTPNLDGIIQFLRHTNVYGVDTIYENITTLSPASIYIFDYRGVPKLHAIKKYWDFPTEIADDMSFQEARDSIESILTQHTALFDSEESVFDLTAGYDSRLIISSLLASRSGNTREINTFIFGPPESREVELVKKYCEELQLKNSHCHLPDDWSNLFQDYFKKSLSITDGEDNCFIYAPILWAQEIKSKNFTHSINGLGGELYRDFWWIQEVFYTKKPANIYRLIKMRVLQYEFNRDIFSPIWSVNISKSKDILKKVFEDSIAEMDKTSTYNTMQIDNIYLREKIRRWAGRTISSSNQLISTISPLLFKKCLEAAMRVPIKHKKNGKLVKGLIEHFSPEFAKLEMLNGSSCQNIRVNNLMNLVPIFTDKSTRVVRKFSQKLFKRSILLDKSLSYNVQNWFETMLRDPYFKKILTYDNMVTQKIYDRTKFKEFLNGAQKPGFLYYPQLGNILTLEMRMQKDNLRGVP